jgi:FKBP-type peptidyl-prolyl cis-trans isomerase
VLGQNQGILCWELALAQTKVGSRIQIICPPDLAYGSEGTDLIPPNTTVLYDIELLSA